ncbi:MAG: hypothetical protein HOQ18_15325 [Dermatophilaceae bacterium]|nr:hypothetical protein [Dermatophilaceae bacterium]
MSPSTTFVTVHRDAAAAAFWSATAPEGATAALGFDGVAGAAPECVVEGGLEGVLDGALDGALAGALAGGTAYGV